MVLQGQRLSEEMKPDIEGGGGGGWGREAVMDGEGRGKEEGKVDGVRGEDGGGRGDGGGGGGGPTPYTLHPVQVGGPEEL